MNRLTSLLRLAQALTSLLNSLRTQKLNRVMRFMWKESLCAIFKNLPFSNCNDSECQNLSRPNSVTPWMLYWVTRRWCLNKSKRWTSKYEDAAIGKNEWLNLKYKFKEATNVPKARKTRKQWTPKRWLMIHRMLEMNCESSLLTQLCQRT